MSFRVKRIAIVGTGLIGGSIGMALRQRRPHIEVIGIDETRILEEAVAAGALSDGSDSIEAVKEADVVFLATPMIALGGVLKSIAEIVKDGAIVTDVGSVKSPIVEIATRVLPPSVHFVGGHPMAGAARGGIASADPLLFENAIYVLTPADGVSGSIPDDLVDLIESLGARVLVLTPESHDQMAAAVSHLPQLLSVALVNAAFEFGGDEDLVSALAAGGFRDMTRIAESPFEVWKGILAANHTRVLDALAAAASAIQRLRNRLIEEDYDALQLEFELASSRRRAIPTDMRGFIAPVHHLMVGLSDRPGALHEVTGILADAGINIKDIELVKIRDGSAGSFRIGFASAEDAAAAQAELQTNGFTVQA